MSEGANAGDQPGPPRPDLRHSLRRLGDTLLSLLQTRLELLNTELQMGALGAFDALVWSIAALVLLMTGLGCALAFVVLVCPPDARAWVLGGMALLMLGAGAWLMLSARQRLSRPGGPFAASIAELARDREHMAPSE